MVNYTDVINEISQVLVKAILEREPDKHSKVHQLDRELYKLLRAVGLQVMSMLFAWLSIQVTQSAKATGMTVHRRKQVKYKSLFGEIEIESVANSPVKLGQHLFNPQVMKRDINADEGCPSFTRVSPAPYLWNKNTRTGARPVKAQLGIEHGDHSVAVERAFADFGAEESFGQASIRFEEHYGWAIDRATMRREVEHTALKAERYVEERLLLSRLDYSQPLKTRPGNNQVLVELDGCHIRTGTLIPIEKAEVTKKRRLPRRKREPDWREVRVGLARPLQDKEKRTYVARMSKYPDVVYQLVSAAVDQGLGKPW